MGPLLLDVATALQRMGYWVEVIVIGPPASTLPSHPALRATGFVDKSRELPRFVDLVRSFHFGCLLSRRDEPFGVSNLECIRLGVPVVGTTVDGIPETVPTGAGLARVAEQTGEEIAEVLDPLSKAGEIREMRVAAQKAASLQSWNRTADRFLTLLRASRSERSARESSGSPSRRCHTTPRS